MGVGLLIPLVVLGFEGGSIDRFGVGLWLWQAAPFLLLSAFVIADLIGFEAGFVSGLLLTLATGWYEWATFHDDSSTASFGFFWLPLWFLVLVLILGMISAVASAVQAVGRWKEEDGNAGEAPEQTSGMPEARKISET